ncbi:MAG: hypothetical protein GX902_06950 [Lentisphaerae bacterium]|nr:hypothetical protein [Lentisphaerota bacterium]
MRTFYTVPDAVIEVYRRGRPAARELFGGKIGLCGLMTPPISYGHLNTLGAELLFPEDGEVAVAPMAGNMDEAIRILRQPRDMRNSGKLPFYLDFQRRLEDAFPGEKCALIFKPEGPLTTAYLLRGMDFFTDFYDDPVTFKRMMDAIIDSLIEYHQMLADLNGKKLPAGSARIADDVAAMIPASLWPELVIPYWSRLFSALTDGKVSAHCEGLHPEQLPLLEELGLEFYDPSISPALTPELVSQHCRIPFAWLLPVFQVPQMSCDQVRQFVLRAAAAGASYLFYNISSLPTLQQPEKALAFVEAANQVKEHLAAGGTRQALPQE